jgi:[ribosomal protein S5]-alanine N-acetyltransferase
MRRRAGTALVSALGVTLGAQIPGSLALAAAVGAEQKGTGVNLPPAAKEGPSMLRIETERLILRAFTAEDWKDFQELSIDWKAAPGPAFDKWPTTEEACRGSVRYMSTSGKYLAMCLRGTAKVVGLLAINGTEADGRLDVGHVILSTYQDNDHDREALRALIQHCFDAKGVPAVITHNDPDHAAQLAPLRSLGFTNKDPENKGELVITKGEWEQWQSRPAR